MPEGREHITSNPPPDRRGGRARQETREDPRKNWNVGFVRQVILVGVFLSIVGIIIYALARTRAGLGQLLGGGWGLALGLVILLALAALWLRLRTLRVRTIRSRLLIAFLGVLFVPAATILPGQVIAGFQTGRQRSIDQLESVVTLKEAAIETWLATLETDLAAVLVEEDAKELLVDLLGESSNTRLQQEAHDEFQRHLVQTLERTQRFDSVFLMNQRGHVVASTDLTQEGRSYRGFTFFQRGLEGEQAHLTWEWAQWWLDSVRPIVDEDGNVVGVLAGRASLATLNDIVLERTGLGDTGETYLISAERNVLTGLRGGRLPYVPDEGTYGALVKERENGSGIYENYQDVPVVGVYHWIPDLLVALVAEQEQNEAFSSTYTMLAINAGVALIALFIAVLASLFIARNIATPLADLAQTSEQIAAGDLEQIAKVHREDEIGVLAQHFNSMTAQLRGLVGSLEQRVAERTSELERRSTYMQASAEVGRAASSILDSDQLIRRVVGLIREGFDLYYVGLFLVDEVGEWATLRAGTGEAGRTMLARGHRLKVGEGMIGWSIAHAQARIALEAEEDVVRKVAPELPDTRSEAALPLRSRSRVLGALTIQDDQPDAFDQDTIAVLQTMADQVAVALDNARLFTEGQETLEAARRAHGELSRQDWIKLLRTRPDLGYASHEDGVAKAADVWRPEMEQALHRGATIRGDEADAGDRFPLAVPIKVRDDVIGVLDTYKPAADGEWTIEEISLLETLAGRLGEALDSARLYQDTQRRASRERLTSEIADTMRRATGVEDIIRIAVDELFDTLGTSRAFVRLGAVSPGQNGGKNSHGDDGHEH
jgi:GAF domain-containing protein/HAMP domain-containing protein